MFQQSKSLYIKSDITCNTNCFHRVIQSDIRSSAEQMNFLKCVASINSLAKMINTPKTAACNDISSVSSLPGFPTNQMIDAVAAKIMKIPYVEVVSGKFLWREECRELLETSKSKSVISALICICRSLSFFKPHSPKSFSPMVHHSLRLHQSTQQAGARAWLLSRAENRLSPKSRRSELQ